MMKNIAIAGSLLVVGLASASGGDGRAKVALLLETENYQPGVPVRAAIRMHYDEGWHGYWVNPGEGGMKTDAVWTLPPGWLVGELGFPVPQRFESGLLVSFGHEGEVLLPVTLHPPPDAAGAATAAVKLSWLACNADACETGSANLSATLTPAPAAPGPHAKAVAAAHDALPTSHPGLKLVVRESGAWVYLDLTVADSLALDGAEVFPVTEQALDTAKRMIIRHEGATAQVVASKSPYASGPLRELRVVIAGGRLAKPILAVWRAEP